jgi:chromosome segregation ATPase
MKETYENIPISKCTKDGMSLNSDDRQYLQRMFCLQDEAIEKYVKDAYDLHAKLICDTVRELLNDFKKEINTELRELRLEIKDVKTEIKLLHVIAEKNQMDIKQINGDMQQMKKDITEHNFRIERCEKHLNL